MDLLTTVLRCKRHGPAHHGVEMWKTWTCSPRCWDVEDMDLLTTWTCSPRCWDVEDMDLLTTVVGRCLGRYSTRRIRVIHRSLNLGTAINCVSWSNTLTSLKSVEIYFRCIQVSFRCPYSCHSLLWCYTNCRKYLKAIRGLLSYNNSSAMNREECFLLMIVWKREKATGYSEYFKHFILISTWNHYMDFRNANFDLRHFFASFIIIFEIILLVEQSSTN